MNLKIGPRIAVGFAAVIGMTVAFGAFAYINTASIDQNGDPVQTVAPPAAYLSEDLRNNVHKQYALLQQFLTGTDGGLDRLDAAIASERTRNVDLMTKLEAVATNDKMRASLSSLKFARDEFRGTYDESLILSRAATPEAKQQALELDARALQPAYEKYVGAADALVDVSRNLAGKPRNIDASNSALANRVLIFLGAAIFLSLAIAKYVIRSITEPLSEAIGVLDRMSEGDLSSRAKAGSEDEIGQLLRGVNRLLDSQAHAAGVAERLAEGDLVVPVSFAADRDVLARALARVRNNLMYSVEAVQRLSAGEFTAQPRVICVEDRLGNSLMHLRDVLKSATEATKKISEGDFEVQIGLDAKSGPLSQSLRLIRDQLKTSTWLAGRMAEGEFVVVDSLPGGNDTLSRSLISLHERLMASTRLLETISEGDLTVEVKARSQNDAFGNAMVRLLESLRRIALEASSSASQVDGVSAELIAAAARLSQSSSQHAAAAAETAVVLGGMANSLRQSADQSNQTDRLAMAAAQDGKLGAEAISQAVVVIKEVADKLTLLDEIGRKSDMLTLAAAVEAARAGAHGTGFGVVASELRKVVERSQIAASEIHKLSVGGVRTAEAAVEFLARLVPEVSKTAELVRELASASAEQNSGATRANHAIQQLDAVIHESVSASQQMAETAGHLVSHAHVLQSTIGFFKLTGSVPADAAEVSASEAVLVMGAAL